MLVCSFIMCVSDVSCDHMVETYSSMGLVKGVYATLIVSFYFPRDVDVSALNICIVLRVRCVYVE